MSDIFPPAKQRPALLLLVKALGCRDNALRRDECGDWRIEGRSGQIYAIPGALDRPETQGFQIYVAGSARWWTNAKAALTAFADLTNDCDDEGMHFLDRLPTPDEAALLRHFVGIAKRRVLSEEERARLSGLGHRFGKRPDSRSDQTGEKPAPDEASAGMVVPTLWRGKFDGRMRAAHCVEAHERSDAHGMILPAARSSATVVQDEEIDDARAAITDRTLGPDHHPPR
jgi:hypothetical protein